MKRKRRIVVSYNLTLPDPQQPSLFEPLTPLVSTPAKDLTIEERFELFDAANPHVYDLLERMALDLVKRGHSRIGIKMLWETLRYRYAVETTGDAEYRLNNIYTSRYARKLTERQPSLVGHIELRELKAA